MSRVARSTLLAFAVVLLTPNSATTPDDGSMSLVGAGMPSDVANREGGG